VGQISACGSNIVINGHGHQLPVEFGYGPTVYLHRYFDHERLGNFFGSLSSAESHFWFTPRLNYPVKNFAITTTQTFSDVMLSLIPFYSSKSVIYHGKYIPQTISK